MPRTLVLSLDGTEMAVNLVRIDREKLYGSVEIEAYDEKKKPATVMVLAADGKTLIDKGGTGLEVLNADGDSLDRGDLKAVNEKGKPIKEVPSSFDAPNILKKAGVEDYLGLIVKSVYLLEPDNGTDLGLLYDNISDGRIFNFPFSYRGGLSYDAAYVLGSEEHAFMVVGTDAELEYLKLNQAAEFDPTDEAEVSADDISFDLL